MNDSRISCDTNILLYYLNPACPEHAAAMAFLQKNSENTSFAISELVLMELYNLLRHPKIFAKPLDHPTAIKTIKAFRNNPFWRVIDQPEGIMDKVWRKLETHSISRQGIFDTRLAFTLHHHGIQTFATGNTKDFQNFGLFELINPIDLPPG